MSPCSKQKTNVVYQPPSLYGGDDEDVSLLSFEFEGLFQQTVVTAIYAMYVGFVSFGKQTLFGLLERCYSFDHVFVFYRGISDKSHHLWYSLQQHFKRVL